jgi:gluconate kinase
MRDDFIERFAAVRDPTRRQIRLVLAACSQVHLPMRERLRPSRRHDVAMIWLDLEALLTTRANRGSG